MMAGTWEETKAALKQARRRAKSGIRLVFTQVESAGGDTAWLMLGEYPGTDTQAIVAALKDTAPGSRPDGPFVSVPASSWKPRKVEIQSRLVVK